MELSKEFHTIWHTNYITIQTVEECNRFWGTDGSDSSDCRLLGCNTMKSCMRIPTFQRKISPPSSGLKCVGWTIDSDFSPYKLQTWLRRHHIPPKHDFISLHWAIEHAATLPFVIWWWNVYANYRYIKLRHRSAFWLRFQKYIRATKNTDNRLWSWREHIRMPHF
jgi:hypothetical protein